MSFLSNLRLFRIPTKALKSATSCRNVHHFQSKAWEGEKHMFLKLWTKAEVIEYVTNNVHYNDGNFIIINKPYGVLSRYKQEKTDIVQGEPPTCSFTMTDILPSLSQWFGVDQLSILVNPERCFSGLTILSTVSETESRNKILENFSKINEYNRTYSYLAIVLGNPPNTFANKLRIVFNKHEKVYKLANDKKEKGTPVQYRHEVLSSSKSAHLVKVDLNFNYLHCMRLALATLCFSPVLGDFVYSPRMTTLFDVPLLVPPNITQKEKILQPEILQALHLKPTNVDCCPCHIHFYSIMLRMRAKKFVMAIPLPEYFIWTCKQLGLDVSDFSRRVDYCSESNREVSTGQ